MTKGNQDDGGYRRSNKLEVETVVEMTHHSGHNDSDMIGDGAHDQVLNKPRRRKSLLESD